MGNTGTRVLEDFLGRKTYNREEGSREYLPGAK
jgi:hypothetical protein